MNACVHLCVHACAHVTVFSISLHFIGDYLSDYVCMFYVYVMCMFCIVFNLCAKFELVKSSEVTLSG